MDTAQPIILIPTWIAEGLDNGTFSRVGSVVRDVATGQIVKLLDEAPDLNDTAQAAANAVARAARTSRITQHGSRASRKMASTLRNNRRGVIIAGATITVGAVTAAAVTARRRYTLSQLHGRLTAAWGAYLHAIEHKTMTTDIIDDLIASLDALQEATGKDVIQIGLTGAQVTELVAFVSAYTTGLAEANPDSNPDREERDGSGNVIDLLAHLEAQRKIFAA